MLLFNCEETNLKQMTKASFNAINAKKNNTIIYDFNCATFFKSGDYSSICIVNSKLPTFNGTGCIYDFKIKGNQKEESLKLQFVDKKTISLAKKHHHLNKSTYKKGSVTEIDNVGDEAYFDLHTTDLKSISVNNKDLNVRYKNITFKLMAEYSTNHSTPCFYTNEELIICAKTIIKNL